MAIKVPGPSKDPARLRGLPSPSVQNNSEYLKGGDGKIAGQISETFDNASDNVLDVHNYREKEREKEKQKADNAWSQDYDAKTLNQMNESLYNKDSGALTTRKGELAINATDEYSGQYKKYLDELDATANNEEQKAMASLIRQKRERDLREYLMRHESGETQKVAKSRLDSSLDAYYNDSVINHSNPNRVEQNLRMQAAAIQSYNAQNGIPNEQTDEEVRKYSSRTRAAIVEKMLDTGNDMGAQSYFTAVEKNLNADDAEKLRKALELGSLRGESQRVTDNILKTHTSYEAAMEAVKERTSNNPKLRDKVEDRVEREFKMREAVAKNSTEETFNRVWNGLGQTKSLTPFISDVYKLPPSMQRQLELQEKRLNNPGPRTNDIQTFTKYMVMGDKIAQVPESEINALEEKLDAAHHDQLIRRWAIAKNPKKDKKKEIELKGQLTDEEMVFEGLRDGGIGGIKSSDLKSKLGSKGNEKKAAAYNEHMKRFNDAVDQLQSESGKKATYEQKQKLLDQIIVKEVKVKKSRLGFDFLSKDERKPVDQLSEEDRKNVYVDDIKMVPRLDRNKIKEALQRRGIEPTDEKILELYSRKLKGGA